ncbi:UDP-N-acetylmuramoyl-tripeptide--D-alanyl-D-alanine ligase [Pelistega sp. NLN82]|uniref:UDP-N-acetylmuramoyl-tripeptide--D-alanyl-D-alanine ligase n=1 Tax=Pelistega ratti TaxID=2652177 RepID=A0A6L9Y7R3_9BURK|nr:UDP-N-acetylmuramoyl-tripeptide--D-alanyl-D-alanine ligase [Pelistega ratti]NEN76562.1 UDP-N-acetylmuramoyl-tripeptide--D-alanyl-D-alanine ligase [Pelistega ratti]
MKKQKTLDKTTSVLLARLMSNVETSAQPLKPADAQPQLFLPMAEKLMALLPTNVVPQHSHPLANYWLLSVTDSETRAKTVSFQTKSLDKIELAKQLEKLAQKFENPLKWLRLEWVTDSQQLTWHTFKTDLQRYKRSYFRSGVAFEGKREPWLLCSEMELNAHACFYNGVDVAVAQVNDKNLTAYLKARHGSSQMPDFADNMPVLTFMTDGVFLDLATEEGVRLSTVTRQHGRRVMPPLDAKNSQPIISHLTDYLSRQVKEDGNYEYGHFPVFGRTIDTYNTLRHASSTYALIEGYEFCQAQHTGNLSFLKQQIDTALEGLIKHYIRNYPNDKAYVIEINNEIKLGANAVAILALVKYLQVFPESEKRERYQTIAESLANGIVAMQEEDGSFVHILNAEDLSVIAKNRVIYYDGEAAFGLMRLYGLTKDQRWLDIVVKAFDYFIAAGHEKAHDHWLSYCSNELVQHYPDEKYFRFAVDNVKGYTSFIKNRITTFPTLLELSMAFHKMLLKLDEFPQFTHVLDGFDVADFYEALHTRANYLLNGIFFPEMAMFYKKPSTIVWGGFIRHHAFRVRIDDVEHYLSGLVAYHQLLQTGKYPQSANLVDKTVVTPENSLTAKGIEIATGGTWVVEPAENFKATGVAIHPAGFKPDCLLVARGKNMEKGYLPLPAVRSFILKGAAGVMTDDPETYQSLGVSVLKVSNVREATLNLGHWARKHFQGRVIGITGSAGKTTTVAMMASALKSMKTVGQTMGSANLPIGVAWNMASLPSNQDYWVLELAIGGMSDNSTLALPDIALITNIAPAHLEFHHNVETIAIKKSRIFEAMRAGAYAVICRDIEQFDLIAEKALEKGLNVVSYGRSAEADMQLLSYHKGTAQLRVGGQELSLTLKTVGEHMAMNALAVLTVAYLEKLDLTMMAQALSQFEAVEGRGNVIETQLENKTVHVYNEAYNANPLSMRAALEAFMDNPVDDEQKIVVLGDMLELGTDTESYHQKVVEQLAKLPIKRIVLVGEEMPKHVSLLSEKAVYTAKDKQEAYQHLQAIVQDKDHIFLKASNGVGLHSLFK